MKQRNPSVLAVALAGSAALAIESTKMVVATTAGFPAHPCSPLGFAQIPLGGISSFRRERQQAHTRAIQLSYHSSPQGVSRTWVGQQHQLRHRQSRVTIEGSRVVRECVQMSLVAGADSEPNATTTPAHAGRHSTHAADTKTLESNAANEARRIRRMDVAVRRIWHQYYMTSTSDLAEMQNSLKVFLEEVSAALEAGMQGEEIAERLETKLLENAQRLDYHLDGDKPMTVYRLWLRGRAIDVYERDLLHSPRWVELVDETRRQMKSSEPRSVGSQGMATICHPNGDIFEGKLESLIHDAQGGSHNITPTQSSTDDGPVAVDAEVVFMDSRSPAAGAGASNLPRELAWADEAATDHDWLKPSQDITSTPGLVSLVIASLDDGLSDEEVLLKRHLRSPDFGNPLLVLVTPSPNDGDGPFMPGHTERDPAKVRAEAELTKEHMEIGERGAKEMAHDRRRSHLDVYLTCAAYRAYRKTAAADFGFHLCEEDAQILDDMIREAAKETQP